MKYEYITSTGKTEIEVDEQFYELLVAMDKEEYNSDRRHSRKHPLPLGDSEYEGDWLEDTRDRISETETRMLFEQAADALTGPQRICFAEVCLYGRTQKSVADELGVAQQTVDRHIRAARKKLKKFF